MTAIAKQSIFASAAHILRAPSLTWIIDSSGAIREDQKHIHFNLIEPRYANLSGGEQALYDIALAIWIGNPIQLNLQNLDDASLRRVLEAITALRPKAWYTTPDQLAQQAITMFLDRARDAGITLCERSSGDSYEEAQDSDIMVVRNEVVQEISDDTAMRQEDVA